MGCVLIWCGSKNQEGTHHRPECKHRSFVGVFCKFVTTMYVINASNKIQMKDWNPSLWSFYLYEKDHIPKRFLSHVFFYLWKRKISKLNWEHILLKKKELKTENDKNYKYHTCTKVYKQHCWTRWPKYDLIHLCKIVIPGYTRYALGFLGGSSFQPLESRS